MNFPDDELQHLSQENHHLKMIKLRQENETLRQNIRLDSQSQIKTEEPPLQQLQIFRCDFSNLPRGSFLKDLCFHLGSVDHIKALATFFNNTDRGIDEQLMSKTCRNYNTIAIKTIRVADIADLKEIVSKFNAKIIHLIRDSSGILNSRCKTYKKQAAAGCRKTGP